MSDKLGLCDDGCRERVRSCLSVYALGKEDSV
jgi:hypothetical protein